MDTLKITKTEAMQKILERITHFNNFYNYSFNKVRIKKQKTLWGSCSAKKNLNFNYKILLLPPEIMDYIIVHELCHLKEFNHSRNFWNLVEKTIPDYKELRKRLRLVRFSRPTKLKQPQRRKLPKPLQILIKLRNYAFS